MAGEKFFEEWTYVERDGSTSLIYPDGCRDILVIHRAERLQGVAVADFDFQPRTVTMPAGTGISGYRMRPGTWVSDATLIAISASPLAAAEIIGNTVLYSADIDDAILALGAGGETVHSTARNAGLSVRSMQRLFASHGLPPPDFWRLLCRARKAVHGLRADVPLADLAYAAGYSDQAHMTRDLVRWFGASPSKLREDARTLNLISQPALGNWTGEQISTR